MIRAIVSVVFLSLLTSACSAQEGGSRPFTSSEPPLRVVATGGFMPNDYGTTGVGRDMIMSRLPHIMGGDASEIRFCYDNVAFDEQGPSDALQLTTLSRFTIVEAAIESDATGLVIPLTFSGSSSVAMTAGQTQVCSDPVYPGWFGLTKFSRDEIYWSRQKGSVPSVDSQLVFPLSVASPGGYTGAGTYTFTRRTMLKQTYKSGAITTGTGWVQC